MGATRRHCPHRSDIRRAPRGTYTVEHIRDIREVRVRACMRIDAAACLPAARVSFEAPVHTCSSARLCLTE